MSSSALATPLLRLHPSTQWVQLLVLLIRSPFYPPLLQFHRVLTLLPWRLPLGHLALQSLNERALSLASRLGILLAPLVALILKGSTIRLLSSEEWGE